MGKSKQQRKKDRKVVLMFDEGERREFLSGFSKRKKERQRKAKQKTLGRLEAQRKKLLDERRAIMADIVREGGIRLQEPQNLETLGGQSEVIDCGEHTVTITELDDAYGAVQEIPNTDPNESADAVDDPIDEVMDEDELRAGGSASDQRRIRLKVIAQELKDFNVQMQPIKASLDERAKKTKKRRQKAQERREQEVASQRKGSARNSKSARVGIKKKKVNKHLIKD